MGILWLESTSGAFKLIFLCVYQWSSHIADRASTGMVDNAARRQLNGKIEIPFLSSCLQTFGLASQVRSSRPAAASSCSVLKYLDESLLAMSSSKMLNAVRWLKLLEDTGIPM